MRVIVNAAISLDGRIASTAHERIALGTWADRAFMSVLRARADAVLVGGRTFRTWTLPLVPDAVAIERLRAAGFPDTEHPPIAGRRWWNVVLSRTLDVPTTGRFYEDPRVRPLFFSPADREVPGERERGPVEVEAVLARLAERGIETLLVEGGGELVAWFLAAKAVDMLYVTVCPLVLGGAAPSLVAGEGYRVAEAPRLTLEAAHRFGDELYCRYRVRQ